VQFDGSIDTRGLYRDLPWRRCAGGCGRPTPGASQERSGRGTCGLPDLPWRDPKADEAAEKQKFDPSLYSDQELQLIRQVLKLVIERGNEASARSRQASL
jgi:hypothetical protein